MTRTLVVFGASGHGKVVADAAVSAGFDVIGFADDAARLRGTQVGSHVVIAIGLDEAERLCADRNAGLVLAIGDNRTRKGVFERAKERKIAFPPIVHPSAIVARSATIGSGSVLLARVVVNPDARIGENVIVNTGACVEHDNVIGDHAHLSPGVTLGGTVGVGDGTHVGIGATVRNNVSIGSWSVIGAGAVVVRPIPDGALAYGVPARVVRALES